MQCKNPLIIFTLCAGFILPSSFPARAMASEESYTRQFSWNYDGHSWQWTLTIPNARYASFAAVPAEERAKKGPAEYDFFVTTRDAYVQAMAAELRDVSAEMNYSRYEEVSFVLAFVQCLPYTSDNETTGHDDFPRFPLETLADGGGDCEDTAILFATLVLILNYSAVFICPPGHRAVGVWGSALLPGSSYLYNGRDYFYCETTGEGWKFGDLPSTFQGVPAHIYAIDENQQFWPDAWVLWLLVGGLTCGIAVPVSLLVRHVRKKRRASSSAAKGRQRGKKPEEGEPSALQPMSPNNFLY